MPESTPEEHSVEQQDEQQQQQQQAQQQQEARSGSESPGRKRSRTPAAEGEQQASSANGNGTAGEAAEAGAAAAAEEGSSKKAKVEPQSENGNSLSGPMAATEAGGAEQQQGPEQGALRMRGLPYSATADDILSFFSAYKVAPDGVTIMMDHSGRPSGQALVVFETPEDAQEALKLDKEKIGGRWIDLFQASMQEVQTVKARGGRAMPASGPYGGGGGGGGGFGGFRGQHPVGGTSMPGAAGPVTFPFVAKVRGLPFDCARSDLVEFFASAGVKENGVFFVHRMDGRLSGEAFVVLESQEALQAAMALDKQKLGNRWLDLFESHPGELFSRVGAAVVMMTETDDAGYKGVVKMRGLPFHATVHDIEAFFGSYRVAPHGIFITTGADGRLTGDAYVVFESEEQAQAAMQAMNKQTLISRWIDLFPATKGDVYSATVHSPIAGQGPGQCPIYATVPMTCARMKGLPTSVSENDLFQFFKDLKVIGLYICRDAGGRATGEAYAEFGSLADCQKAMAQNMARLPGNERHVEVTAASKEEVLQLIELEKSGGYAGGAGGGG